MYKKINMKDPTHHLQRFRFQSIDSLKGLAMVLVIMQHSYLGVVNFKVINPLIHIIIIGITSCAPVAFVTISGMMYSYFLYSVQDWKSKYIHYTKRAALLLAIHPVIKLMCNFSFFIENIHTLNPHLLLARLLINSPITDLIGICMLVAPLPIIYLRPVQRVVFIVSMLIITVFINAFFLPSDTGVFFLKEAIFGSLSTKKVFWFSLVPWLSIFLAGSFMGHALMQLRNRVFDTSVLIRRMNRIGIILTLLSAILITGYYLLRIPFRSLINTNFLLSLYPGPTTTLLPGYLAVLLFFFALLLERININRRYSRISWLLSIMGRTSLFTFVIQFAVVKGIPEFLGYKGTLGLGGFFFLFISGQAITLFLSYLYGRLRGWISKNDYEESLLIVNDLSVR
jgi:uncharacterized membrane protein